MVEFDKFYTKSEVAKLCVESIDNLSSFDIIVEPSAGNGAFMKYLPTCLAYDILPEGKDIIKVDFFDIHTIVGNKILFIGNPPFGNRSELAFKFIRHCIELNANTIAFILPEIFNKYNIQYRIFPKDWCLKKILKIPNNAFLIGNSLYHVPCSFFIWTKEHIDMDLRKIKLPQTNDFEFLSRENEKTDFCLNGNNGKIKNLNQVTNTHAEHYIKSKEKSKDELIDIFTHLNFTFYSSVNGGVGWIGQQEILEAYYNYLKKKEKKNEITY